MPARKKTEFQVHGSAAVRKPRAKKAAPKSEPVTVVKANPATVAKAHELAAGRDVHLEIGRDGAVYIRN